MRSGGEENERQMENNLNCKEMRFVIRNLIDVDDVSPATAPKTPFDGLELCRYFPKEEGMMQYSNVRYFPRM